MIFSFILSFERYFSYLFRCDPSRSFNNISSKTQTISELRTKITGTDLISLEWKCWHIESRNRNCIEEDFRTGKEHWFKDYRGSQLNLPLSLHLWKKAYYSDLYEVTVQYIFQDEVTVLNVLWDRNCIISLWASHSFLIRVIYPFDQLQTLSTKAGHFHSHRWPHIWDSVMIFYIFVSGGLWLLPPRSTFQYAAIAPPPYDYFSLFFSIH